MQLWTKEHAMTLLPAIAVMLVIAAILRKVLGNKSLTVRMIPFQVLAGILFLIEIGKQICSLRGGYDLYHLPFHFCSLFIFMLPLMALYRGKHQQALRTVTVSICTATTLLMLIYPCLIYGAADITNFTGNYLAFHTVVFHNIVVFEMILCLALDLWQPAQRGSLKTLTWFMVGFCAVSATMAQLLKTNYNNFYTCNVPPLEALRLNIQGSLSYVPTQILYIAAVTVLDILFVLASFGLYRLLRRLLQGRASARKECVL